MHKAETARIVAGYTIKRAARLAGLSALDMYRIEQLGRTPPMPIQLRLAGMYGLPVDRVFGSMWLSPRPSGRDCQTWPANGRFRRIKFECD